MLKLKETDLDINTSTIYFTGSFYDLKLKHIDESIISNALENCDISFEDKISEYFSSKFDESELADAKYRAKVYRTLIGRGYTNDQVRDIIDR